MKDCSHFSVLASPFVFTFVFEFVFPFTRASSLNISNLNLANLNTNGEASTEKCERLQ